MHCPQLTDLTATPGHEHKKAHQLTSLPLVLNGPSCQWVFPRNDFVPNCLAEFRWPTFGARFFMIFVGRFDWPSFVGQLGLIPNVSNV